MTDLPLHRNPEFTALWVGQTVSSLGTSISTLAYPLLILAMTGSPGQAGLVSSALAATTFLIRLPAGILADRMDRRKVMLVSDGGRAIALASVAFAAFVNAVTLPHILIVAIVEAALGSFFGPAEAVAVRRVVAPDQVQDAVAMNETRRQFAGLLGPSIGGLLFGFGRAWPFIADAASYFLSFITVWTIKTSLKPTAPRSPFAFRRELLEGLEWLWGQRFLRAITLWMSIAGVLFTSMGLVSLVIAQKLGATSTEIGLMYTIIGAGALAGSLAAPWLLRRLSAFAVITTYASVAVSTTYSLVLIDSVWVLGAVGALAFFPVPSLSALIMSQVATTVPDELHGKAFSATNQLTALFHPVGPAVAGFALQILGTGTSILIYGSAFLLLTVAAFTIPAFRSQ